MSRLVARPLYYWAALNLCGGRSGAPPEPPAAECVSPAASPPSAFLLTVTFFPYMKNRTGFAGRGHTGPTLGWVSE